MSETFSKVEVITGVARRRRFPTEQKLAVVAETMQLAADANPGTVCLSFPLIFNPRQRPQAVSFVQCG